MELITAIYDFAIVLIFAGIVSILFSKLNQPAIFGYLVAGSLIGPYALKFVRDLEVVSLFAELSIIFLIFSIGLEFNLAKLRKVGVVALFTGTLEMILIVGIGNAAGRVLGLSSLDSIFLGGILAISSTAIIAKILIDRGEINKEYAQIILGILIVEDVGAVILLTVFGGITMLEGPSFVDVVLLTIFKIVLFFVIALVIGLKFIPEGINRIGARYGHEILLITVLGLCFALAAFSDYLGFSVALGAFIMGAIISESKPRYRREIEKGMEPIRILFTTMFFVSIGMLVNLFVIKDILPLIISIALLAILVKFLCCGIGTYLSGYSGLTALYVGMGLIPRGEFSFIIAKLGIDAGLISPFLYQVIIAVAMITTIVTPPALESAPSVASRLYSAAPMRLKELYNYTSYWINSVHRQLQKETPFNCKPKLTDIAVNFLIIIFILIAVINVNTYILKQYPPGLKILSFILAGIFMLPPTYLILKKINELIDLFIEILKMKYGILSKLIVRRVIHNLIYITIIFLLSIIVFPLLIALVSQYDYIIVAILITVIVVCGYFFWKTVNKFHGMLDVLIRETLLTHDIIPEHCGDIDIIERLEKNKMVSEVKIYNISPFAGKTISDTRLRTLTGATILFILRGGNLLDSEPNTRIESGDVLILLGRDEARENAEHYLQHKKGGLSIIEQLKSNRKVSEIKISDTTPFAGKTISDTRLRTLTGATILFILRGGNLVNPEPTTRIESGDVLIVLGTEDARDHAEHYLHSENGKSQQEYSFGQHRLEQRLRRH
jgi:CPA2 family monovalent cation:H+ antiporter-2